MPWRRRMFSRVAFDDGQVAKTEEVHLQQTELLDRRRLVLGDDRRVLARSGGPGLALHRHVVEHRLLRDHDGGRVDAVLAALVDEAHRHVDRVLHLDVVLIEAAQFRRLDEASLVAGRWLEARLERQVLAHHQRRHRLCDLVAQLADSRGRARRRAPRRGP